MTFIAFLLKFAFFIFIAFLAILVWIAFSFYRQLTRVRRQFDPFAQQQGRKEDAGSTVIDKRTAEQRNRKVIPDGEGEYVDFTEVDDPGR
ncbi:DUF4834 domain-containing protein [Prevotella multiformis]|uniref:DUF4834 domain-containing protein n=1 Tax=Prevotella multiformis TaxID=282402 RepID=UPI001BA89EA7|nr:DUF4834 domain-containing protein [Prevotella multiformis]QUB71440.1 DUF4834 domain-containing protein [Prevotella multiformis]